MPGKRPNEPIDPTVGDLLYRLNSADAGAAWAEFLDRFAALIMNTANQFEFEQDRINECFLYVSEKLSDHGFRRLLKFNTGGKASFHTWLVTVVYYLCIDWHRKEFGRATLLPSIAALPVFDRMVYRYSYEQALGREACFEMLKAEFPDLTRRQLGDAMGRVHAVLTPRQRWQLSIRISKRKRSQEAGGVIYETESLPDSAPGPEFTTQTQEDEAKLKKALSGLPPEQRLALLLRFQDGMTLKAVAEITGVGDPFRARRLIQAALDDLSKRLSQVNFQNSRKN